MFGQINNVSNIKYQINGLFGKNIFPCATLINNQQLDLLKKGPGLVQDSATLAVKSRKTVNSVKKQ